jgi:hypothetical protein
MKKLLKIFSACLLLLFLSFTAYLNIKLYYTPTFSNDEIHINSDVIKQLNFLKSSLHNGAADNMQQAYPEGFVFTQAVYGLSWVELAAKLDCNSRLYKEAHHEIFYALNEVESPLGRNKFDKTLPIPFGAYYIGWSNYLLGKKLSIENLPERNPVEIEQFKNTCQQIDSILKQEIYPESYKGYSWPADVFAAVASLKLYDNLFKPFFEKDIQAWIEKVKANTDKNGFIPYASSKDGKPLEIARGSSESLILNFLVDIDPNFARQQFALYKEKFLDHRFGLPGIREFPKGNENTGDVDSGPVILDMGSAATIVGMRVLALYNDTTDAVAIRNGIEAFGLAYSNFSEKKYLFGKWTMADVFIVWAHTTEITKQHSLNASTNWRLSFQLYSLLFTALLILLLTLLFRRKIKTA